MAKAATGSASAIAKVLGISPRQVSKLAAEGVIPKSARGQYELLPAVNAYCRHLRENPPGAGLDAVVKDPAAFAVDLSLDAMCDLFGLSHEGIRKHVKAERLKKTGRGRYPFRQNLALYLDHLRDVAAGRGGEDAQESLARERSLHERAKRIAQERRNQEANGVLVDAGEVGREWSNILSKVRSALLAIPSRARSRLPHLTVHDVDTLDHLIRGTLTELGEDDNDAAARPKKRAKKSRPSAKAATK